jgi:hypothetical protein
MTGAHHKARPYGEVGTAIGKSMHEKKYGETDEAAERRKALYKGRRYDDAGDVRFKPNAVPGARPSQPMTLVAGGSSMSDIAAMGAPE